MTATTNKAGCATAICESPCHAAILGLLRDREHLLALRDVFDARPPLNWSVGTTTANWEGVTLAGTPPRVVGLNLSNRNLQGEIWGYLGDLLELRVLRLDGNQLTGLVPSKTQLLKTAQDGSTARQPVERLRAAEAVVGATP